MRDFDTLCQENYGRIYKYIFALTGSREVTEDLCQDVFTVAFDKGAGFLSHENPTAFLYKTARNLALTYLKCQRSHPTAPLDDAIPSQDGDLLDELLQTQDRQIDEGVYVQAVLGELSPSQRALFDGRYDARRPIGELAAEQGVSETAMRMRLVRLRREIFNAVKKLRLDEL